MLDGCHFDVEGHFCLRFDFSLLHLNCSQTCHQVRHGGRLTLNHCCHVGKKYETRCMGHMMLSWKRTEHSQPMPYKYFCGAQLNFTLCGLPNLPPPTSFNSTLCSVNQLSDDRYGTCSSEKKLKMSYMSIDSAELVHHGTHSAIVIMGSPMTEGKDGWGTRRQWLIELRNAEP